MTPKPTLTELREVEQVRSRVWRHVLTGWHIWLPEDKRSFSIVNRNGQKISSRTSRSLYTATRWCGEQAKLEERLRVQGSK